MKASESTYNNCLYWASSALARKVNKLSEDAWKKVGLAPGQAYLLMRILEEPGQQPMQLSGELHLAPSTITRFIEKLEKQKLAVRVVEGKITNVYPTPKAKGLAPVMQKCMADFKQTMGGLINKNDYQALMSNILKVADKLPA